MMLKNSGFMKNHQRNGFFNLLLIFLMIICSNNYLSYVNGAAVMSVDLGNEWMKVGVVSPGVPMEIALNKESKRKTPAVLAFRDGIRTFGEDAQTIGVKFPAKAYGYLFDLLGKTIDNPIVQLYRKRFPYYEIIGDPERNTVIFKHENTEEFKIEELIAQILQKAKEFAEDSTQQLITECVLIVPGYFGQAERSALLIAAELANLKVLQLINDYTAVALNYGVFHRAELNETTQYYIFYDMGAQKTSAAVVSYQLVKEKSTRETHPVIQVLGVGYDRTLGGLDIQLRLRDYLAQQFNALKLTKTDVFTNPRALAKLFKEAGRLKNVLSANNDHYAQIENLIEDNDFKLQVTREILEDLCKDMWPRVVHPLRNALKAAGLTMDVINQVIIFGGGTRVPKIQELLKNEIQQELGKSLNSDEAAVMGAVYKAADLAIGFKVKKFIVKDAVLFPIQIVFDRSDPSNSGGNIKQVKRVLFGPMNSYPQKKVITFNKHINDFEFAANYADLDYLSGDEISYLGSLNLTTIQVNKVAKILDENRAANVESKGIKAHFLLDDSGLFSLSGIDFVFEKTKKGNDGEEDASTLSMLGSKISKLFSGDSTATKEEEVKQAAEEESKEEEEIKPDSVNKTETTGNGTTKTTDNLTEGGGGSKTKNDTIKIVTIKAPIEHKISYKFAPPLAGQSYDNSYKKLSEINRIEMERTRRESAFNDLETHVIETVDKMNQDEYTNCATEHEKSKILEECASVQDWLYDGGEEADADQLEKRLNNLRKLTNEIYARHWEHEERPEALKALTGMINHASKFLQTAKNLTKATNPVKDVYTEVELDVLVKVIAETEAWQKTETEAQKKLLRHEVVQLTVKDIADKMSLLDREVKYLVNKLKIWRPKTTIPPPIVKTEPKVNEEAKQTDGDGDSNANAEANASATAEANASGKASASAEANANANNENRDKLVEELEAENAKLEKEMEEQQQKKTTPTKKPVKPVKPTKSKKKPLPSKTEEGDPETQTPHGEL